jgi:hypothetical protein
MECEVTEMEGLERRTRLGGWVVGWLVGSSVGWLESIISSSSSLIVAACPNTYYIALYYTPILKLYRRCFEE